MEIIKLLLILCFIITLLAFKRSLGLVIALATVLTGVLFAMPVGDFFLACGTSIISVGTISITLCLWFVMLLEGLMSKAGYMERMLKAMDELFHNRCVNIISMPMIIGFLPSAGGALFSAPLVENATAGLGYPNVRKAITNVYYRHVMEAFFPTYPSLIICSQMCDVPLITLSLYLFPLALAAIGLGLYFLRPLPRSEKPAQRAPLAPRVGKLLLSLWPFLLLIGLIVAFSMEVYLASLITLVVVLVVLRTPLRDLPALIKEKTKVNLLVMCVAVMVFKDILSASGAVERLPELMAQSSIPPLLMFSLLGLFISLLTGMMLPSIAIMLPLLIAAIPDFSVYSLALLYLSAYIGSQISPTHLCIVLTSEYFHVNLNQTIFHSLPVYAVLYALVLGVYGFLLA